MKLRKRLLLLFGLNFLVLLIVSSLITIAYVKKSVTKKTKSELTNVIDLMKGQIETAIDASIKSSLKTVTEKAHFLAEYYYRKELNGELSHEDAFNQFKNIILDKKFGKIGESGYIFGIDEEGNLKIHPFSEDNESIKLDFFEEALRKKKGFWTYNWRNKNELETHLKVCYMSFFEPWKLLIGSNAYKSEVARITNINKIAHEEFRKSILGVKIGEKGYPFILNSKGDIIIHPTEEGKNSIETKDINGRRFIKEICSTKSGIMDYALLNQEGSIDEKIAIYRHIPDLDWIIVATANYDDILASYYRIQKISLWIIVISIVLIIFISLSAAHSIVTPIKNSIELAEKIAKGDLTSKIETNRNDEVGQLINALDLMSFKLKEVVSGVIAGSSQMAMASQQLAERASEQASSVEEISSSMEELSANINQNTSNAQETNKIAKKASEGMGQGKSSVDNTLESVTKIAYDIQTIQEIAEKTDLLAINASIEAARAGEHGKGFSVVATEVRKLAERSQKAAISINSLSKQGVDVANTTGKVIEQLVPEIQKTTQLVEEITAASTEQSQGIQQVNTAIQELNGINQNNASSAEEIAAQAQQLNEMVSYFRIAEN